MAFLFDTGIFSVVSAAGATLPGAKLYFYAAGTSTPQNTYSDMALTVPNLNPVVADANGRFSEIWMGTSLYKIILTDASGVTLETRDNVGDHLGGSGGSGNVGFLQAGAGAVSRTAQDKMREKIAAKDFGALGDGATNDGAAIGAAITAAQQLIFTNGTYKNTSTAVTFPFGKTVKFEAGADISASGSGSSTFSGVTIREGYNPSSLAGWTGSAAYSYEGLSVELGGYGPRQFGSYGTPTALNGSINIPSTATIANHGSGISGYAKSASTTTGGVAIYGESNRTAASALVWGLNTRTQDGGFGGLNVWGYEMDMNVDNITTTAVGFDAVGASTVEPSVSVAYQVQAIGVFASPKKRWQYGFRSRDAAAVVGIELGAQGETANTASQIFNMNYRNGANAVTNAFAMQISGAGDASIIGGVASSTLFVLKTPGSTQNNIALLGNNVGFFGATPAAKPTVTGSRGGNAALASLLTALSTLGLITDSSS